MQSTFTCLQKNREYSQGVEFDVTKLDLNISGSLGRIRAYEYPQIIGGSIPHLRQGQGGCMYGWCILVVNLSIICATCIIDSENLPRRTPMQPSCYEPGNIQTINAEFKNEYLKILSPTPC